MNNKNIFNDNTEQSTNVSSDNISLIRQGLQDISQYIKDVLHSLKRRISFDEYLEITSNYLDKKIIELEKCDNITFIAGKCNFSVSKDKKELYVLSDLFFKDNNGEWIQKTVKGKTPTSNFKEETQKGTLTHIYFDGLSMDVDPPVKGR